MMWRNRFRSPDLSAGASAKAERLALHGSSGHGRSGDEPRDRDRREHAWPSRHGAPPWWPASEPWPPQSGARPWRRRRARFVRRIAVVFALLLVLSVVGAITLVSSVMATLKGSPYNLLKGSPGSAGAVSPFAIAAVAAVVIVAAGVFALLMRRVAMPLSDVVAGAGRVASGDYAVRLAEHGPTSLRSVARAFNNMTAQLHAQDQQRRDLMADVAHELRTPLTVMQGQLEGLLDGVYPRDDERLNEVLDHTRLLARLVEDLRTLAHAESGTLGLRKEATDLGVLVHDAAAAFASDAAAKNVVVRVEDRDELPLVDVDPVRIREVLMNLLSNALRHSGSGGGITIRTEARHDAIVVSVRDTGAGIPPEVLPRIFDRFYKGPASHGSGLGLTIARNLVVSHGGEISAESRVGEGTTVTFTLPRVAV
jgi:two-component system OmpR family sensor kinase/two-component system sensor histidine kinase BaeS